MDAPAGPLADPQTGPQTGPLPGLPRIAYLTGTYPLVSLTFIQREVKALRDQGIEVETVSCRYVSPDQFTGPQEQEAARTTHCLLRAARSPVALMAAQAAALRAPGRYFTALRRAMRMREPGIKSLVTYLAYFIEATMMAQFVRQKNIGHIHCHFATNGPMVALLTKDLIGTPYSFTLHGPSDLFDPEGKRIGAKAAEARFVATISHYARSQLMLFSDPKHWDRFRIIHCGVYPELYAQESIAREDDEVRLIFVGRLAPVKGIRVLFEALDDLFTKHPQLRLTVVGDGPDRARLEAEAKQLNTKHETDDKADKVRFTGYMSQQEVAEALAQHDVFVLPSFAEGVPVVLMEAMISGLPVVATQVAGVGELVEHGVSGMIAPPGDVQTLKRHIETLLKDSALRRKMGESGRKTVQSGFVIEDEAARLARLFAEGAGQKIRPLPLPRP